MTRQKSRISPEISGTQGNILRGCEGDIVDVDAFEGKGIPLAVLGSGNMSKLAPSKTPSRYRAWAAKAVMDNKSGRTRIVHEIRNPIRCFAKNRVLRAA